MNTPDVAPSKLPPRTVEPPIKTVKRAELETWRMVAGNEDVYTSVVDDGWRKDWVAIGWITVGMATEEDKINFPTVVDE
jgi:hypothetical protein